MGQSDQGFRWSTFLADPRLPNTIVGMLRSDLPEFLSNEQYTEMQALHRRGVRHLSEMADQSDLPLANLKAYTAAHCWMYCVRKNRPPSPLLVAWVNAISPGWEPDLRRA